MNNDRVLTGVKAGLMLLASAGIEFSNDTDSMATTITAGLLVCYGVINAVRAFFKKPKQTV